MAPTARYEELRRSAADCMALVRDGDAIVVPTGVGEAPALLAALGEARTRFRDVKVSQILPPTRPAYLDPATVEHVRHVAYFFSGVTRPGGAEGLVDFYTSNFSEMPMLIERGLLPADVVMSRASLPDAEGWCHVSLAPDYTMAALARARVVLLEVNPNVPAAHGPCRIHLSKVHGVVETRDPITEVGLPVIGPVQEAIGAHVAELIHDGDTLQIGYGGIPDAVVMQLKSKHDLGIHTEMIGDGILSLLECGAANNSRKNFMPGKTVATFALGSKKLYTWMHANPALEMHPVDFTNLPWNAARNDKLVSINGSLEIDFLGQCCSESLGSVPFSGTGGQTDFVRAANLSRGGRSFIVLPSTAKNGTLSRIVPTLTPGSHVTTSKNDVNYVVTEYGVAQLRGRPIHERVRALIAIAHPDFREELRAAARRLKWL